MQLDELRSQLVQFDSLRNQLETNVKIALEAKNSLVDVTAENRNLAQKLDVETKRSEQLNDDLVKEKAQHSDVMGRLRLICSTIGQQPPIDDNRIQADFEDIIINSYNCLNREIDTLRSQLQIRLNEIDDRNAEVHRLR
jgi:hypothetical protein